MNEEEVIRDPDLLEKLEKAKGGPAYQALRRVYADAQRERDEARAKRAVMSRDGRRRDAIREIIENDPATPENIQHIHSVLALCGLPYKAPPIEQGHFFREYGKNTLSLSAGPLKNPETGKMEVQGLPYGPKARLLLLHLCTEAVRQRTPTIAIADSLSGFIRDMGFEPTGGPRGTLGQFKEQLNRLAGCTMKIGLWDGGDHARTINTTPIEAFDVWLPRNPDQRMLWSSTITFDQRYFESLMQHALPVDIRAVRAFAGSARKLDMLFWFGYRMSRLDRPLKLTWENLQAQFGADIESRRRFRQVFRDEMAALLEVYPKLPTKLDEGGLTLYPADASKLLVPPKRTIRVQKKA